jgi:hypothetical protein
LRTPFFPVDLDLFAPRHSDVVFRRYDLEREAILTHQLNVLGTIQDEDGSESPAGGLCAADRGNKRFQLFLTDRAYKKKPHGRVTWHPRGVEMAG